MDDAAEEDEGAECRGVPVASVAVKMNSCTVAFASPPAAAPAVGMNAIVAHVAACCTLVMVGGAGVPTTMCDVNEADGALEPTEFDEVMVSVYDAPFTRFDTRRGEEDPRADCTVGSAVTT